MNDGVDVRALVQPAVAHVGVPLPAGIKQLALDARSKEFAVGSGLAMARTQCQQAQAEIAIGCIVATEIKAERVVNAIFGNNDVVRGRVKGQWRDLVPRMRAVHQHLGVDLHAVGHFVIDRGEHRAALLRRDQQVVGLIVEGVGAVVAAVIRQRIAQSTWNADDVKVCLAAAAVEFAQGFCWHDPGRRSA